MAKIEDPFGKICSCGKTDWCPEDPQSCGLFNEQGPGPEHNPTPVNIEDLVAPLLQKYSK